MLTIELPGPKCIFHPLDPQQQLDDFCLANKKSCVERSYKLHANLQWRTHTYKAEYLLEVDKNFKYHRVTEGDNTTAFINYKQGS